MIARATFEYIRGVLATRTGTCLEKGCDYLIESRLLPAARELKASSVNELVRLIQAGARPDGEQILIEALCDKDTAFFRDVRVFDTLRQSILPDLIAKRGEDHRLNIWSIGCATGQEPYSVAMLLHEHFPQLKAWKLDILGSDISLEALQAAGLGRYNQVEINRGLPAAYLAKCFQPDRVWWRLEESVCQAVRFSPMNVLEEWPSETDFDLVLLRNVISRFAEEAQIEIFRRLRERIRPGGCLLLGAKENLSSALEYFNQVPTEKFVYYQPKALTAAPAAPKEAPSPEVLAQQAQQQWIRLAQLAGALDRSKLPVIREIFLHDLALADRLKKSASRGRAAAQQPPVASVDAALQQVSKEHLLAFVLAPAAARALNEVFEAMASASLNFVEPPDEPDESALVTARAGFYAANAEGLLLLRLQFAFGQLLAAQALGLKPKDVASDILKQTVGQMLTLIAGNFQSHLAAAALEYKVESVDVTEELGALEEVPANAGRETLAFSFEQQQRLWLDVVIMPEDD